MAPSLPCVITSDNNPLTIRRSDDPTMLNLTSEFALRSRRGLTRDRADRRRCHNPFRGAEVRRYSEITNRADWPICRLNIISTPCRQFFRIGCNTGFNRKPVRRHVEMTRCGKSIQGLSCHVMLDDSRHQGRDGLHPPVAMAVIWTCHALVFPAITTAARGVRRWQRGCWNKAQIRQNLAGPEQHIHGQGATDRLPRRS